uniref:Putative amidase n=1 Tax=Aegilops tauschii TaxID=37682 RepID=M8BHF4_AEGTA
MDEIGQIIFLVAENTTGINVGERAAINKLNKLSADGLEKLMREHELDAIVTPNSVASPLLAIGGMPGITMPAGYGEMGVPFGLSFCGLKGYEPRLIEMAYAFEQVTMVRNLFCFASEIPICRTLSDAVHVLDAIVGYDELDAAATRVASKFIPPGGYVQFLKKDGLRGKRVGVLRGFFQSYAGTRRLRVYEQHLATMRKHGAMVVDNLHVAANPTALLDDISSNEGIAVVAEFKLSINAYLADLVYSPVRLLADIIAFNNAHPIEERMKDFGQDDLIAAQNTSGIGPVERAAIRRLKELSANGLEKLMKEHQLDAIVTPGSDASSLLATGGHPGIIVPAGFNEQGVPFGICFGGLQGYEPRLIEMAYAFEQATKVRKPPMFKP